MKIIFPRSLYTELFSLNYLTQMISIHMPWEYIYIYYIVQLVSGNTLRHRKLWITSLHILSLKRVSNGFFDWTTNPFLFLTDRVCWSKNASKCECLRITLVECLTQESGTSILKIDTWSRKLAHHKRRE